MLSSFFCRHRSFRNRRLRANSHDGFIRFGSRLNNDFLTSVRTVVPNLFVFSKTVLNTRILASRSVFPAHCRNRFCLFFYLLSIRRFTFELCQNLVCGFSPFSRFTSIQFYEFCNFFIWNLSGPQTLNLFINRWSRCVCHHCSSKLSCTSNKLVQWLTNVFVSKIKHHLIDACHSISVRFILLIFDLLSCNILSSKFAFRYQSCLGYFWYCLVHGPQQGSRIKLTGCSSDLRNLAPCGLCLTFCRSNRRSNIVSLLLLSQIVWIFRNLCLKSCFFILSCFNRRITKNTGTNTNLSRLTDDASSTGNGRSTPFVFLHLLIQFCRHRFRNVVSRLWIKYQIFAGHIISFSFSSSHFLSKVSLFKTIKLTLTAIRNWCCF